jgi:hypothetical protein
MELKVAQVNKVLNIQFPFSTTQRSDIMSWRFSAKETPNYLWELQLNVSNGLISNGTVIEIYVVHINPEGYTLKIVNPVLVKL